MTQPEYEPLSRHAIIVVVAASSHHLYTLILFNGIVSWYILLVVLSASIYWVMPISFSLLLLNTYSDGMFAAPRHYDIFNIINTLSRTHTPLHFIVFFIHDIHCYYWFLHYITPRLMAYTYAIMSVMVSLAHNVVCHCYFRVIGFHEILLFSNTSQLVGQRLHKSHYFHGAIN